jgi:hypothetical protein
MNFWILCRKLWGYLAPERPFPAIARKQIAIIAALLGVAAIAGAVVLKPSRHTSQPDVWAKFKGQVASRAKIDLFDDFSGGLDAWESGKNMASSWNYDKNGFVNPGALSLFTPSMHLTDYDVDTVLQIESKGVGLAVRANSPRDYQAVRMIVEGSGPMPDLFVERYDVSQGQVSHAVRLRCPARFQAGTLYHVHLQAQGDSFALYIQGQLVDYWSAHPGRSGGVGLFCGPGEHARVAWIRVSQNSDALGRMCSALASVLWPGQEIAKNY